MNCDIHGPSQSLRQRAAAARRRWGVALRDRLPARGDDRGDVPGWVLVTLMTAGLVLSLWAVAEPQLTQVFDDAVSGVVGGP